MLTPTIAAGRFVLRPFADHDVDAVLAAAEDPSVQSLLGLVGSDRGEAEAYISRAELRAERGLGWSWAVAEHDTNACVGQVGAWLRAIAPDGSTGYFEEAHGRIALGYWVVPARRGTGIASAALDAASAWLLEQENVGRLELFIEPSNVPSWRAAERAGFQREGLLRSFQLIDDRRRDMLAYSRLPSELPQKRSTPHRPAASIASSL